MEKECPECGAPMECFCITIYDEEGVDAVRWECTKCDHTEMDEDES